jgi:hypothetical protein
MNAFQRFRKKVFQTVGLPDSFMGGGVAAVTESQLIVTTTDGRRCLIDRKFPAIHMNNGDSIKFTWTVTLVDGQFTNGDASPASVSDLPPEVITGNQELDERIRHYHEQLNS